MLLRMSQRERDRLKVIAQLSEKKLCAGAASELLGLTARQVRRLLRRYEAQGDAGLVHQLRGRRSNRSPQEEVRSRVMALVAAHYRDYGPKLASEVLSSDHGIVVSRETVRQWMVQEGLWKARAQRVTHRQWRERRACVGELVQMDTSIHDWFEGRGEQAVLIAMIDDATSRVLLRFYPTDSTATNMDLLSRYIRRHGRPVALYTDKASHFTVNRVATLEEDLAGVDAQTQIQRALRELDVECILAHSPQAKGRVERLFKTLQDRLVKALRRKAIGTIAAANAYLEEEFLPQWRRQFAVAPACAVNGHRSRKGFDLAAILSIQHTRTVGNDYTLQHENSRYQIAKDSAKPGLRRGKVIFESRLDGQQRVRWRNKYLLFRKLEAAEKPLPLAATPVGLRPPSVAANGKARKPAHNHPWKKSFQADISNLP
jgi:transposase-like protein